MFMILKCTEKNCLINVFDVFFPQLSNDVSSFNEIFHFHLQKVQNMLYLKKCIFNIFFDPIDRKLTIFYVGEDIFQRVPEMFFARNRMWKRFWRWKWKISKKLSTSLESWGKNTLKTLIKQFFKVLFSIINMS